MLIEGIVKSWSFEVSECPSRGYWKQFLISRPYEHSQWGVGGCDNLPRGKVSTPPPQPSCMLSLLCNDQRDSEEPGQLKFPIALQEDAGNNVSYPVPMNIVSRGWGNLPRGKVSLPPQPSCILSFLCNDQRDLEEPGHLKFLIALQEDAGNNFSYLVPKKRSIGGGRGAQSTPG